MPKLKFDHVAFLVRDLDQAVRDYQEILSVLDPEQAKNIVWDEGEADGYKLRWATFVNPNGTSIQFFESQHPADQRLLEKYGERVHHLAFTTSDLAQTIEDLQKAGIPLTSAEPTGPPNIPWLKWVFVPPRKAHGVLIEVATRYRVEGDRWVPDEEKGVTSEETTSS